MRSIHVKIDIHSQQFFRGVPNIPNQLIGLGHDPESFYDEEMVGHICLNKYDLDVWFNLWIFFKVLVRFHCLFF